MRLFTVPNSVKAISPLAGRILVESEALRGRDAVAELHLFYNRPKTGAVHAPVSLEISQSLEKKALLSGIIRSPQTSYTSKERAAYGNRV
jgi:hypothetical protein